MAVTMETGSQSFGTGIRSDLGVSGDRWAFVPPTEFSVLERQTVHRGGNRECSFGNVDLAWL